MPDVADLTPATSQALARLKTGLAAQGFTLGDPISGFRTYEDQRQLYANYQAGKNKQPLPYPDRGPVALAARPGTSPHEFGVAFDTGLHGAALDAANKLAPSLGLTTVAGDPGHFQLASWHGGQAAPDVPAAVAVANAPSAPAPSRPASPAPISAGPSGTGISLLANEFTKRGVSPAAASGAIAGVMGESGPTINPLSFNTKDPGGGSGGIGQWNRGRLVGPNGMLAFARDAGVPGIDINTPTDSKKVPLAVQAQYLGHELDTTYSGVLNQLRAAKSPQDALNTWVNDYENPADKAGAIAQRSQYLAPVAATLAGGGTPAAAAPTPGTTINTSGLLGGSGDILPGFTTKQGSDQFLAGLKQMGITPTTGAPDESQGPPKPSPIMQGPGLINAPGIVGVAQQARQLEPQLTGYQPQVYGGSINSQPMAWGSSPIGAPSWLKNAGAQQPQGLGTSLNSLQALDPQAYQDRLAMLYGTSGAGGSFGGGYG